MHISPGSTIGRHSRLSAYNAFPGPATIYSRDSALFLCFPAIFSPALPADLFSVPFRHESNVRRSSTRRDNSPVGLELSDRIKGNGCSSLNSVFICFVAEVLVRLRNGCTRVADGSGTKRTLNSERAFIDGFSIFLSFVRLLAFGTFCCGYFSSCGVPRLWRV